MSHFCVAVFTDGNKTVEELLAPYQENNMGDCPKEYMKFYPVDTEEQKKYYEKYKEDNQTFEEYLEANGYLFDEEEKAYGYYENPNAKWDWWQVGGRFRDLLVTRDGFCDISKIKDVDFSEDKERYDESIRWWEVVVEGYPLREGEKEDDFFNFYKIEYLKEKYKTKENYAKCQSVFATFAVITPDGKWYEKGNMGWWACVSNEDYNWDLNFKERFIDTANPDWTITIVDCHI